MELISWSCAAWDVHSRSLQVSDLCLSVWWQLSDRASSFLDVPLRGAGGAGDRTLLLTRTRGTSEGGRQAPSIATPSSSWSGVGFRTRRSARCVGHNTPCHGVRNAGLYVTVDSDLHKRPHWPPGLPESIQKCPDLYMARYSTLKYEVARQQSTRPAKPLVVGWRKNTFKTRPKRCASSMTTFDDGNSLKI